MEILTKEESLKLFEQLSNQIENLTNALLKEKPTQVITFLDAKGLSLKLGVSKATLFGYIKNRSLKEKASIKNIEIIHYEKKGRDWIFQERQ